MKKTNFTKIPLKWCLGANWLKGLVPLLAFFVFALPMQIQAQQAPNCSNFSPSINESGQVVVGPDDFVTNHVGVGYPLTVNIVNQWGGSIMEFVFPNGDATVSWNVCAFIGKSLSYTATNGQGTCTQGVVNLSGTPAVVMTSRYGTSITGDHVGLGKINVYCGFEPTPNSHIPTAVSPCGGRVSQPKVQPDWIMPVPCNVESDTAKVIFRTWEVYDKEGNLSTLTDTIVVFRLPRLTPGAFVGSPEDSFYCEIVPVPESGEGLKRYASWKQPIGLHDYELPYSKLRGVTYEIPATIIIAGLVNAASQGPDVLEEYLECVILRKANGGEVTIGDIVSGTYMNNLINNATNEQRLYGFLQVLIELNEKPINVILEVVFNFYPYLLLEIGDWILSEGGQFEEVTADWFYNGNGNSPYWFAGGWPSIYGSGDCISYCDVGAGENFGCVEIRVPALNIDNGLAPGDTDSCIVICLPLGPHCGITLEQDPIADWTGNCPQTRGIDSWITQTCWAETENRCAADEGFYECGVPYIASEESVVIDYSCTEKAVKVHTSQWQTLYDTIGPIFDFCYPVAIQTEIPNGNVPGALLNGFEECFVPQIWDHEEILDSIRAGKMYTTARIWEQCNPTVYTTTSHDCAAEVYVPSVRVIDNCSGVHSVKASVRVNGGTRMVALVKTATETHILPNGDECFIHTYSHLTDPIRIPFTGCYGELTEVRYEAADECWNQSEWYKYIRIEDATPPTVVVDRAVNVTLNSKTEWVYAETFDEGSWDNCAIDLKLVRRTDWLTDTACVDICGDVTKNYNNWVDILVDLGVRRADASAAVAGSQVGYYIFMDNYQVNALKHFLSEGEVEEYYFNQIVWLLEDDERCGPKVVHGWLFALAAYIAENCSVADEHGNKLKVRDLEAIFDNLFAQPGYGNEIALLGGGWSQAVPFKCEDACEEVSAELLVMDYCCNWSTGWSTVHVEDKSNARLVKRLPDLDISCEAYNIYYKDVVEAAASYGEKGSISDTSEAFTGLDEAFGTYIKTWVDNQNRPTDIDGNLLPEEALNFEYWNVTCEEKSATEKIPVPKHDGTIDWITKVHKTTFLDSALVEAMNGIIAINCYASCEQDVWVDLDECGQGTITRRFFITSGCSDKAPSWEIEQVINVGSACGMRASMFDLPAETVGTKDEPICLPQSLSNDYLPDTIGNVTLKSHLVGKLCNAPAVGKTVKAHDVLGQPGLKKYTIEWEVVDWCAPHTSTTRSFKYIQEVIATIDPSCEISDDNGNDDITNLIQGKITTEMGEPVQRVEMKAVLGNGSPLTTVTSDEGSYSFSINEGSQVSLVPSKNTGFANGISTQDLIDIQRHVLQKNELGSKYKKIAADVNGNGTIDGLDVLELRKLVMKPDSKLPNNTSWRFFDTKTDMEVYDITKVEGDMNVDFIGVKIGDVNLSGDPARSSRSVTGELSLNVADKTLKAGELYRVDVTSDNFVNINGMQYTLSYLTNLVEVEAIEPGALNITKDHYLRYAPGVITSSWSEADGQSLSSDVVLFTIVVKAKSEVQLRDAFSLNNRVTTTEAYDANGGLKDISLRFDGQDAGFALYQNTPNPFEGQTVIGFKLPEASKATLSVYDVTGKVLKIVEGEYNQGYNEVKLKSSDLNATGVLYYQLDTKTYTATKKMIVIE